MSDQPTTNEDADDLGSSETCQETTPEKDVTFLANAPVVVEPVEFTTEEPGVSEEISEECQESGDDGEEDDTSREPPIERLDPRWITLCKVLNLLAVSVLGLVATIVCVSIFLSTSSPWRWSVGGLFPLVLGAAYGAWILPSLAHRHWSYQLAGNVVMLRHGIVWKATLAIPVSRLQHVDLHSGPMERRYGLASLQLHTAGTQQASHTIPGLDQLVAASLRDRLINAVDLVKRESGDDSDQGN